MNNKEKTQNILIMIKSNKEYIHFMINKITELRKHNAILRKMTDDYCSHEWETDNGSGGLYCERRKYRR